MSIIKGGRTSWPVLRAVVHLARQWRQDTKDILYYPTLEEALAVWELVTNNGLKDQEGYLWGGLTLDVVLQSFEGLDHGMV